MAIVYLGVGFLAALATGVFAYAETGSWMMGLLGYSIGGTVALTSVMIAGIVNARSRHDLPEDTFLYPAE
jgi:multisubunit Na+/H+ antiporter MnhB subunit